MRFDLTTKRSASKFASLPYNGYTDQRQIRLEEVVRIAKGRSPSAKAARVLLPKEISTWAALVDHARLDLSDCSGLLCGVLVLDPVENLQDDAQNEYRTEVEH